jgi:PLP dependent protein
LCDAFRWAHRSYHFRRVILNLTYQSLLRAVDDELERFGRPRGAVTIVGVSKKQPVERIRAAIAGGLRDVGENYLQEARRKFEQLPPVRKHFIGHLQTNKAKAVAALFDVVQCVDRGEAALALAKAAQQLGKELAVLVQVNISPTERFGCPPGRAPALADLVRDQSGLRLEGIMAIGPLSEDRAEISRAFELAAKTFDRVGGSTLSIGMSGDWPLAVRAGSTMIRIGTALFGGRLAT